ncbi:hypothetical protein OG548_14380 [Streptomyces sp. NBC_01356]|uniref:hypothetical protein n=1 Tax=Streptomyces sp. NBC_01356 TaxID=2903836 RepID=UPI002E37CEEC|nr:hypothetical protein [Streptomyces sp. NBC_01356]
MSRDLKNNVSVVFSLLPAARTAAADGAGVDLANYSSTMVIIEAGTATGTTPSFEFEVQESDLPGSGYTAVATADLDGAEPTVTTANDEAVYEIGYRGIKRYLRVINKTPGGTTTPTLPCSALVLRGSPRVAPK